MNQFSFNFNMIKFVAISLFFIFVGIFVETESCGTNYFSRQSPNDLDLVVIIGGKGVTTKAVTKIIQK